MIQLPSLLFVCTESRNIMYDALLTFRSDDPAPRGPDVQMFLKTWGGFETNPYHPLPYGYRVMDFSWPDLKRVGEADGSNEGTAGDAGEVVVDPEFAPEGFVRLLLIVGESWKIIQDGTDRRTSVRRHRSIAYGGGWRQPVWS